MADVKWIKITTDIFDDEKILLIESLPDAYAIITVWFKLLCLAGKQNNSGVFMIGKLAFTDKMLATIFRMKESTVTMALQTFEQFGMVEIIDGVITIPNWEKHQTLDKFEQAREQTRKRVAKHREKQKLLAECNVTCNATVTECNADRIEEDKDKDKIKNKIEYQLIADMYNDICISFPRLTVLSDKRKQAIKARSNTYTLSQFEDMFHKAESSSFLKGANPRNWRANFDWLMKDANFAKVLDGNYTDTPKNPNKSYDTDDFFEASLARSHAEMDKELKTAGNDEAVRKKAEALKAKLS